jgi:hypothetical protein
MKNMPKKKDEPSFGICFTEGFIVLGENASEAEHLIKKHSIKCHDEGNYDIASLSDLGFRRPEEYYYAYLSIPREQRAKFLESRRSTIMQNYRLYVHRREPITAKTLAEEREFLHPTQKKK